MSTSVPTRQTFGAQGWTPERLPNLSGKTFVVTGANSGIGLEAVKVLVKKGGRVFMLCRNLEKAAAALTLIEAESGGHPDVHVLDVDLASLASVRNVATEIRNATDRIDGLVCNAGIMMIPERELTPEGFEMQLAVNHYAHFALCGLLQDLVENTGGRFAIVASEAHKWGLKRIKFEDLDLHHDYSAMGAYGQSKLANILFCIELERRLRAAGRTSSAVVCHPGYAATNLQTTGPSALMGFIMSIGNRLIAQSAERGSWPTLLAAAEPEAKGGAFYGPTKRGNTVGPVQECIPAPFAQDFEAAERLWEVSEQKTGVDWSL